MRFIDVFMTRDDMLAMRFDCSDVEIFWFISHLAVTLVQHRSLHMHAFFS